MDAKLGGGKRKALAEHLKESIDTLEIKVRRALAAHQLPPSSPPFSLSLAHAG